MQSTKSELFFSTDARTGFLRAPKNTRRGSRLC
jgi:hypothetical protein